MDREKLILIGGGGHAKACIDVIYAQGRYDIIGYIDKSATLDDKYGVKYLGDDNVIPKYVRESLFIIAIGQLKTSNNRVDLFEKIKKFGGKFATVMSPTAYISRYVKVGEGSIIMHNVTLQTDVTIGDNCIINDLALIEHDCIIGNHVHISTGAIINGNVLIKDFCFIGSNSTVIHGTYIDEAVVVGAGAVVINNISKGKLVKGNPAK